MKKALYILLCLSVSISLISCNGKDSRVSSSSVENNNITAGKDITKQDDSNSNSSDKDSQSVSTSETKEADAKTIDDKTKNANTKTDSNTNSNTSKVNDKTSNQQVQNTKPETPKAPQTKNNKVIVLDPGHANKSNLNKEPLSPGSNEMKIKDGGGAQGVITRTPEYQVNMNVAVKLKELLESKGYTVVMTKTQNSQSLGNVERADIWNKANAALVVRIHADSAEGGSVRGASMLVPAAINDNTKAIYSDSKKYGQIVLNSLVKAVGMPNRGIVERSDMTGFNWSKVPVILVEMGFLSNKEEDKLLSSNDYQDKLAKGLADGICAAIK